MSKPSRDKSLKYRELRKKLHKFGVIEFKSKGKGSHRMFYYPDTNKYFPVKCHGEGTEISRSIVQLIRQKFNIKIEEFY